MYSPSASPQTLSLTSFSTNVRARTLPFLSAKNKTIKIAHFLPLKGVESGMHCLLTLLPNPSLCEAFDLTGASSFLSKRYINDNGEQESAIEKQRTSSVRAYGGLDTLPALLGSPDSKTTTVQAKVLTLLQKIHYSPRKR